MRFRLKAIVVRLVPLSAAALVLLSTAPVRAQGRRMLRGHVPMAVADLQPVERLPGTDRLSLAIGLPLRNTDALNDLLRQIYDPASPDYHHYLTPEQFTEQFGPTQEEYEAVAAFAQSHGLTVTGRHPNRVLLEVSGSVADVEKTFRVVMRVYRHPGEDRTFYAPDGEPSVDAGVPVLDVSGLDNFALPHPAGLKAIPAKRIAGAIPDAGSAPSGNYIGNDFRAAYVPGVALKGTGQSVGLLEFDGFNTNDIYQYEQQAGLSPVNLVTNLLGGFNGGAGSGNGEVALDIDMAISMAPGLSSVIVYEAPNNVNNGNTILSRMATDNLAKQLSSSWTGMTVNSTTEQLFQEFASQGQSFFQASGDSGAYTGSVPTPAADTNITVVGGTALTTSGPGGSWVSETTWSGSGGGISTTYPIPGWQTNINMTTNQGSTTMRNLPDVSIVATNIWLIADNGITYTSWGTSAAAPLWAGFIALVNQQAVAAGHPTAGFVNPAIYAIGKAPGYASLFHDITTGNDTNSSSANKFSAVPGYDLCTGWGSPLGASLINALAGMTDPLGIAPATGFTAGGLVGGPFNVTNQIFALTNSGTNSFNWTLANTSVWLTASSGGGTLASGAKTSVTLSLNSAAAGLIPGTYNATVWFTNLNTGAGQSRPFALQVLEPLAVTPATGFTASGPVGGPFNVTTQNLALTNIGSTSLNWSVINTSLWLNVSPGGGTLPAGGLATETAGLNSAASNLAVGVFTANVLFTNQTSGGAASSLFTLLVGQSLVQNGGFETGDFTGWNLNGDGGTINFVASSSSVSGLAPHSGTYYAALGEPSTLAYLSQTLPTLSGQTYLLSLWMNSSSNPNRGHQRTPNEFSVAWNGATLFDQSNIGIVGWTNLHFVVTAAGSSTVLQFGVRDDPYYLGLDDVSVVPIPTPSFRTVTITNAAVRFTWLALSGQKYQLQYKTNLAQSNWMNLGSAITATNSTMPASDSVSSNSQRFYRILFLP